MECETKCFVTIIGSLIFAAILIMVVAMFSDYHLGGKQQIAAENQRNYNRCQAVIIVTDRVCDSVDAIFAAQAVEEAIAKADK